MVVVCLAVMPRAGWVKPVSDRRLSDLVSVGVLTRVFPPELVDEVVAASGLRATKHGCPDIAAAQRDCRLARARVVLDRLRAARAPPAGMRRNAP